MTRKEASRIIKDGIDDMSLDYFDDEQYEALNMAIKALEQEPCDKYIKEIDHLRKYISKLETQIVEQEPCGDVISREPFTDSTICEGFSCNECSFNRKYKGGCILEERVMNLPPVNPIKTGHWIDKDEKSAVCSCCNRNNTLYGDFCKWCGAKMVEPQEERDKEC